MNPINDQQLDEIEAKAAELRQKIDRKNPWPSDNESHWTAEGWKAGTRNALDKLHVEQLVAEVRRLRAAADRTRALTLLEAANFLRDAFLRDPWLSVQEISNALRNTADQADPMVGSLARDGFGPDEIAEILARPAVRPSVETGA